MVDTKRETEAKPGKKGPKVGIRRDLTKGSIFKNVVILAWPMVLGNVLQNAFNVVDMIFVGRLGPPAIAAVSMSGMLMSVTWTLLVGISIGTTAMVARFFGAGDEDKVTVTAMQSLSLGVVASVILVVFGMFLGRGALGLLGAKAEVLELGEGYVKIVFVGSFTLIIFFLISSILRGSGDSLTPMLIMTFSTTINIALDPLLIFGIWIFPRLGVRGAAYATVFAQGVAMVAGLFILLRGYSRVHLHWRSFKFDFDIIRRILKIALPGTVQGAVRSAAGLVLMRIVAAYGVFALAAYGIGLRLDLIIMMPGWALGGATATLVGQNLGAKQPRRAELSAWTATGFYILILAVVGGFFFVFPRGVIGIFNNTPDVLDIGSTYLRIRTLSYVFLALGMVLASGLNGAGDTFYPMIILAISLLGIQIPLALLLPKMLGLDILGIWLAIAISFVVQGVAMAGWFRVGRWKHKEV